jgi:hypothetical protein
MSRFALLVNVDTFAPVQVGGANFVKGIPKEFPDGPFVDILIKQNPHHIVECDADGKPLTEVPAPMQIEPEVRTVRSARDEEVAKDNLRHIQEQEHQRVMDGQIKPQESAVAADAVEPDAVDIEVPAIAQPDTASEIAEAVAATATSEPEGAPEPEAEVPSVEVPTVPKKKRK